MKSLILYGTFWVLLLKITVEDFKHHLINPKDVILGVGLTFPIQILFNQTVPALWGMLTALISSGSLFIICMLIGKKTGKDYFGFGDVWVSPFIGCVVGAKGFICVFIMAFYVQVIWGLSMIFLKKVKLGAKMPFIPMLSVSIVIYYCILKSHVPYIYR